VTVAVGVLLRDPRVGYALGVVAVLFLAVAVGSFGVSVEETTPDPASFDDALTAGLAGEERFTLAEEDLVVPRAQVFYSQYRYVVGYHGIEHALAEFDQPGHAQQFGYPIAVYVWDFADTGVALSEDGYLHTDEKPGWTDAETAQFVVDSEARTPAGETAVPFSSVAAARSFADRFGGRVVDWTALQDHPFDVDDAAVVRSRVDDQRQSADERVSAARPLADREVSVTVGEGAPTIQAAIDAAPPETAVRIPPGTYDETLVVDKPLTLRGESATIRGNGTGSVIRVTGDDAAVVGVSISGVGNRTSADEAAGEGGWDETIASAYGYGDAGITVVEANRTYIAGVAIETPANGILLRDVGRGVVERVAVDGTENWEDGFMGVLSVRSPVVVQASTVDGGRDGVYLHHAPGSVIRNNTFRENRFGVHFMYTSDSLIADNVARSQEIAGITIMTDPTRNAVVGNEVRNAKNGIIPGGSRSYVAENVVANNGRGLTTSASNSLYERNVIYGNDLGVRTDTVLPSNRVVGNDFVANAVSVEAGGGPLRIWTHRGDGNYWADAVGRVGGVPGSYSPTDPVDGQSHRTAGTLSLSSSPAATALDAVRDTAPGMRDGDVLDTAPRAEPVRPDVVAALASDRDE
jgi:parallel beta-helix repeat protein